MSGINTNSQSVAAGVGTLINFVDPATGRIKLVKNRSADDAKFQLPQEAADQDATAQQQVEYDAKTGTVKVTVTYSYKTYDRPAAHAEMTSEQINTNARTERVRVETKHVVTDTEANHRHVVTEKETERVVDVTPIQTSIPLGPVETVDATDDEIEVSAPGVAPTAVVTSLTPKLVKAINVDSRITDRRAVEDQLGGADFNDKSEDWHRDRIMDLLFERYDANSAEAVHRSLIEQLFPRPVFAA